MNIPIILTMLLGITIILGAVYGCRVTYRAFGTERRSTNAKINENFVFGTSIIIGVFSFFTWKGLELVLDGIKEFWPEFIEFSTEDNKFIFFAIIVFIIAKTVLYPLFINKIDNDIHRTDPVKEVEEKRDKDAQKLDEETVKDNAHLFNENDSSSDKDENEKGNSKNSRLTIIR